MDSLRRRLKRGEKAVIGKKGYRRYLERAGEGRFQIKADLVAEDAQYDGLYVLRRSQRDPEALASYFVHAPKGTSLAEMAAAAGLRWTIEECFLRAKDDLGLDHCEARSWHGWHRHMSLVMAAAAFLAKLAADQRRAALGQLTNAIPMATAA